MLLQLNITQRCVLARISAFRFISTTAPQNLDQKWRKSKGLTSNPNAFGPLTNLPDYTFMDGRPSPIGSNLKRRIQKQQETAEKIVTMCKELDFAKERFARIQRGKEQEKQKILDNKLKPKGHILLKK